MSFKDLHISPTDNTPEVIIKKEGLIMLRGKGLVINKADFFDEVYNWVCNYAKKPAEITNVILAFEYLNSFSLSLIVAIIKTLRRCAEDGMKLSVSWYYEEDDDDILERGHHLSHIANLKIEFIPVEDIDRTIRGMPYNH
ncbi:MAG: SiaC family regulatory phosphoprotein [Bacteroidales bacterium]